MTSARLILQILGAFITCTLALAEEPRRLSFKSNFDRFELLLSAGEASVEGKRANLSALKEVLPLIARPISEPCSAPLPAKPDLAITENGKTKSIYIESRLMSDGKNCVRLEGDGLYFLPIHRDFLIGRESGGLKVGDSIKIFRQGVKLLELKQERSGDWSSSDPKQMLDWDFIHKFTASLKSFSIRSRTHAGLTSDKLKMIVQLNNDAFEFYKISQVTWAMRKPNSHWLVISDDWTFWHEFDAAAIEDKNASEIRQVLDTSLERDRRLAILAKWEHIWSINLRNMYHALLDNREEDASIQRLAVVRLKTKPSPETTPVLMAYLNRTTEDDLRSDIITVLRLRNAKGPRYKISDTPENKQKVLQYWNEWWRRQLVTKN